MQTVTTELSVGQRIAQARDAAEAAEQSKRIGDLRQRAVSFGTAGGARRRAILEYLALGNRLYVNCKYQLQVSRDADLQRLLKEKKVVLLREGNHGLKFVPGPQRLFGPRGGELRKKSGKHQSFLALAPDQVK